MDISVKPTNPSSTTTYDQPQVPMIPSGGDSQPLSLVQQAKMYGQRSQRRFQGMNVDVFVFEFIHGDGVVLLYENLTSNMTLDESIHFDVVGYEVLGSNPGEAYPVYLGPGSGQEVILKKTANGSAFRYNSKYDIYVAS